MENERKQLPDDIENLIFYKDYDNLSKYEVQSVAELMSESEYRLLREVARSSREYLTEKSAQLEPEPATKEMLMQRLNRKNSSPSVLNRYFGFLGYRLPVYRFALTFMLLVFIYFNYDTGKQAEYITIPEKDTVFIEKPVLVYDTVKIENITVKHATYRRDNSRNIMITAIPNDSSHKIPKYYNNNSAGLIMASRQQKYGSAYSDDEKYMKFLTVAN
jgi:hypothetical protein